jgi:hypothetical protein
MKKRKMIVLMLTAFIIAIISVGCFIMNNRDKKISISEEQKHRPMQVSGMWDSGNQKKIVAMNRREINKKEANTPSTPPNTINPVSVANNENSNSVNTSVFVSGIGNQLTEEEKRKFIEEQDKHCMELMHERGWYKPEDIPITYTKPQEPTTPAGVYLWEETKGVLYPKKKTPEFEARNRELSAAYMEAFEKGDTKESTRIAQELIEFIRPYQPLSVRVNMHLERIPSSWSKYFLDLANAEQQKIYEGENRH